MQSIQTETQQKLTNSMAKAFFSCSLTAINKQHPNSINHNKHQHVDLTSKFNGFQTARHMQQWYW
jgi:hypothetical protein